MIQNFNFYDIYGYLLPGLAFLGLLWLPYFLLTGDLPATEWTSAIVGVALAYMVGHVLQNFAAGAVPYRIKDAKGNLRYPSEYLLDAENFTFTTSFKRRLAQHIRCSFGIDPEGNPHMTRAALFRRRQEAFFLCRVELIKAKSVSYAEQFEGMYALMRGLAAASLAGGAYYLGLALGGLWTTGFESWAWLPVMAGLILTLATSLFALSVEPKESLARWAAIFLLLTLFGFGNLLASATLMNWRQRGVYLLLAGASVLISLRCFGAYKRFALEFPRAVYLGFYNHKKGDDED